MRSTVERLGTRIPSYKIPLATVASPDNLTPQSGNVYSPSVTSGEVTVGTAGAGGLGAIDSKSLEQSTVDLATELTKMVEAQRACKASGKRLCHAQEWKSACKGPEGTMFTGARRPGRVATGNSRTPRRRCGPRGAKSCRRPPRMLWLLRPRSA